MTLIATFTPEQLRDLADMDGLYVGLLDKGELRLFEDAIEAGLARRSYDGTTAAMLGLSKVKVGAA